MAAVLEMPCFEDCGEKFPCEDENPNSFLPPLDCLALIFQCLEGDHDNDMLALALTCKDMYAAFGIARGDAEMVTPENPRKLKITLGRNGRTPNILLMKFYACNIFAAKGSLSMLKWARANN